MGPFDNILKESLDRYFNVLEQVGYIKDADTNTLMFLSFIEEFLEEYQGYITEEDYNSISRIISCFADNSCLVPYGEFKQYSTPLTNYIYSIPIRISELSNIRHTEADEVLRLVNL